MHTYNTGQPPLKLKEYGRNIQRLIGQLDQINDRATKNQYAQNILKIMGILYASHHKAMAEHAQKRWDDFCIIADYKVDVDSPYPIPNKELLHKRPQRLSYSKQSIKYRHCGRHIELFVKKVLEMTTPFQRTDAILSIVKLIKNFSSVWNKDNPDNNTIMAMIQGIAGSELALDIEQLKSEAAYNTSPGTNGDKRKPYKKRKVSFVPKVTNGGPQR